MTDEFKNRNRSTFSTYRLYWLQMLVSDDGDTVLKCDYVKWTSTRGRGEGAGKSGHGEEGVKNVRILLTSFIDSLQMSST